MERKVNKYLFIFFKAECEVEMLHGSGYAVRCISAQYRCVAARVTTATAHAQHRTAAPQQSTHEH